MITSSLEWTTSSILTSKLSISLDLELASGDTKPFSGQYYVNDLACLIKWFYEDPVSEEEKERNEKVFNIQGNRNPFIDHPEYLKILYPELTANY